MRIRLVVVVGILAFGLGTISAEATPIFANGDFEAVPGPYTFYVSMNGTNTPGWTIGSAGVFPIITSNKACGGTYGAGNQGCNFGVLGGGETNGTGFISQNIAGFVAGDSYTLSWLQSSEYLSSDIVYAQIIGAATLSQSFVTPPSTLVVNGPLWNNWRTEIFPFTADAASLTFRFSGFGNLPYPVNYDPGVDAFTLDNVTSTAVPEPASLVLLGTGLLATVSRFRRRRSTPHTSQ